MLHVLELGRDNDAVMMAAGAWQNAEQLIGRGIDNGNAAGLPLKAAERRHDVFAVIGDGGRLQIGTDTLNFLLDLPRGRIDHHHAACRRRRMQHRQIKLRAVERKHHVERVRVLTAPERVLDMGDLLPFRRVRIARIKD